MEDEFRWEAPEFHYHEKTLAWYWGVGAITLLLIVIAIFQGNFLFALFSLLAGVLVSVWGSRAPNTVPFTLTEKGFAIAGKKFYAHDALEGFALIESHIQPEVFSEIVLRTRGQLGRWIKIMIPRSLENQVRERLERVLPELEYEESMSEHIARMLRF